MIVPCAGLPSTAVTYAAFDAGPLRVCRLEERRVLAADILGGACDDQGVTALGDGVSTLSQPVITAPGNQSTTEGATLTFSPAAGREIRIDAVGLGANPLVVDLSAFDSLGQVTAVLNFGSTSGLTVTGNGINVFQLRGSLTDLNAALATLSFHSPDDANFALDLLATDPSTGENASASLVIQVANASPQVELSVGNIAYEEGNTIEVPIQLLDAGVFDNPQASWTVSNRGTGVASGTGLEVQFFAVNDGVYEVTVTAMDKDGAATMLRKDILVQNVNPGFELRGVMHSGVVDLSVVINDPGQDVFTIQIYWTGESATPETFFTSERTLAFSHRYTSEELASANELTIAVHVSDGNAIERQTLHFREGDTVSVERPEFSSPPRDAPPERTAPSRVQPGGSTSQIVSADLGRSVTSATQTSTELHQFVLRVVGPDGEESQNYPLPAEALADLPAFLTRLGVPDGHYRIYLVAGDLERLVIDGHLRAGRIVDPTVDPTDVPQGPLDGPPGEVALKAPNQAIACLDNLPADNQASTADDRRDEAANEADLLAATVHVASPESVPMPVAPPGIGDGGPIASPEPDANDSHFATPIAGAAIVICAASTIVYAPASRRFMSEQTRRFCKKARLVRKLARQQLKIAGF